MSETPTNLIRAGVEIVHRRDSDYNIKLRDIDDSVDFAWAGARWIGAAQIIIDKL